MESLLTEKQKAYLELKPRRINLLHGSVRSGKTWISLVQWAFFVRSRPIGDEFLMIGKTITTLKRNCLGLLEDLVGQDNFTFYTSTKMAILYGRTIWLEGADNERAESKIRGMTLAGAYMDEMTLIPSGFSKMLLSRLSVKGAKLFATTNPDVPANYVYTDFIQNKNIDIHTELFTIDDNTFLDADYVKQLKLEYTGVYFQRYILGMWVRAEGAIFRQFADNPERWTIASDSALLKEVQFLSFGLDYGENTSHTAMCACGILRGGKGIIALDEEVLDSRGVSPDRIEVMAVDFVKRVAAAFPWANLTYCWCDHPETITNGVDRAFAKSGLSIRGITAKKEEINTRIYAQTLLLNTDRMKLVDRCKKLSFSLCNQVWDEKKQEDTRLDDNPDVADIADAWEYSFEPFIDEIGVR